ncbi:MAG: S8 family serine peptidase [bacterium]
MKRLRLLALVVSCSLLVVSLTGCGETWEEQSNTALITGSVVVSGALIAYALSNQDSSSTTTTLPSGTITFESTPLDATKITTEETTFTLDDDSSVTVERRYVNDQVIVRLVTGKTKDDLEAILPTGYTIVGWNTQTRTYQVTIPSGTTVSQAMASIGDLSSLVILTAGKNFVVDTMMAPNDEYFNTRFFDDRWGFVSVEAQTTWDVTTGASSILLAIIDTGIDLDHDDFAGRLPAAYKYNFVAGNTNPADDSGHGTCVAGIAAASGNNSSYMAGMDWNASIMAVKAIDSDDHTDAFTMANAMSWALDNGAKVLNCSFGMYMDVTKAEDRAIGYQLQDIAQKAYENNAIIIAATGNHGRNASIFFPAAMSALNNSPIVSVGGYGQDGERWSDTNGSSNYGDTVDICAPAEKTLTTWYDGNIQPNKWGTSIAAPFVSGTASLIYSLYPGSTSLAIKLSLTDDESTDVVSSEANKPIGRKLNSWKALLRAMYYNAQAVISVSSDLGGADIYVNGTATGKTTTTEGYTRIVVSSGTYTISASKEGYAEASTDITIIKGTNTNVGLTPGGSSSNEYEFGPYTANSNTTESLAIPAGAQVYIQNLATDDGEKAGFFNCGSYGYFGVSTEASGDSGPRHNIIFNDAIYDYNPGTVYTTYYCQPGSGVNYFTAAVTTSGSVECMGTSTTFPLSADGLWLEITDHVTLGETNYFYLHHDFQSDSSGKGFVIKVEN